MKKYWSLLLVMVCLSACKIEDKGMKIMMTNDTYLDITEIDLQRLNCLKILPSLEKDLLQGNPFADICKVHIISVQKDTVHFNIELFRTVDSGISYRVANMGGKKMVFSKEMIKETVCRFVNK